MTEDVQEGQTLVHGLGALHLEIVEGRLQDEWGVKVKFGKRRVSYRENMGRLVDDEADGILVDHKWSKDMGGKHVEASLSIQVRALTEGDIKTEADRAVVEAWGGNLVQFSEAETGKTRSIPPPEAPSFNHSQYPTNTSPVPHILQGFATTLSSSPHSLLPLSHVHITVKSHSLSSGSPLTVLSAASSSTLLKALHDAGPGHLMEPYVRVKVDVGDEGVGKVVKDLNEHHGEILDLGSGLVTEDDEVGPYPIDDLYIPPKWLTPASASLASKDGTDSSIKRTIWAVAPLSRMLDYSSRLRAVSGGQATFELSNDGFRAVGDVRRLEILKEIGRA